MHITGLIIAAGITVASGTAHGKYDERTDTHRPGNPGRDGNSAGCTSTKDACHREGTREVHRAIKWVAPHLRARRVRQYSRLIYTKATRRGIDPLLVVALIYRESRFRRTCASKKNYGLMQVRVSHTTNPDLLGREHLLHKPRINFTRGMRLFHFWKKFHERTCSGAAHFWTSHYQWGSIVRNPGSGNRVRKLYQTLVERFRKTQTFS